MVATVAINELNGAVATKTDKTGATVRFKNADNATVDLNNPLVIPGAGQEYSFRKVLRAEITGGSFTQISNIRGYMDGANNWGTGVKGWSAVTGTFTQPAVPSEGNDPPQFPGTTPMIDLFTYTSGSPVDLDASNAGPWVAPGDIGDYWNLVMEVEPTASQGAKPGEVITFAYDEI